MAGHCCAARAVKSAHVATCNLSNIASAASCYDVSGDRAPLSSAQGELSQEGKEQVSSVAPIAGPGLGQAACNEDGQLLQAFHHMVECDEMEGKALAQWQAQASQRMDG